MRRLLGMALMIILAGSRASADPGQGFTTGMRLGYALPAGDIVAGASLSGDVTGTVPAQVDLLYRVSRGLALGGYFAYAQGIPKGCPGGFNCQAYTVRLGLQAQTSVVLLEVLRPWAGVGAGYEWLGEKLSRGGLYHTVRPNGPEYVNLQVGLDFQTSPGFWVGPYSLGSLAKYTELPQGVAQERRLHGWVTFGIRAAYELGR